jgi:DNA-binding IclR family transcriptional regulator
VGLGFQNRFSTRIHLRHEDPSALVRFDDRFTTSGKRAIRFLYVESHSRMRNELDQATGGKFVGAVENAVVILRYLAHASGPLGVAPIARETGLNVSTTFNILRTLTKEGLVVFDTRTKSYRIGLGVLEVSAPLLGTAQADLIHPELERLSAESRSLIGLWKITPANRIVLVDRVVGANTVRVDISIGSRLPAFVGAVGRCVAATRDLPRDELLEQFRPLRWQDPPSFDTYAAEVREAVELGYAFDLQQLFRGVDIAAAVIRDHTGAARFGISAIVIAGQMTRDELSALAIAIRDTANTVERDLYGRASTALETRPAVRQPHTQKRRPSTIPEEENAG